VNVPTLPRIGLLGGTFDPPHIGHMILAECAADALNLTQVHFIPAAQQPLKLNTARRTTIEQRLAMIELVIRDDARFVLSRMDVDRAGPHYTADLVRLYAEQYPHSELYFLMGDDSFRDLSKWQRPQEIIHHCQLVVMPRSVVEINPTMHDAQIAGLSARTLWLDAPLVGLSATEIAERLQAGKTVRYMLLDRVLEYIHNHALYRG
jgi:nicotinate-nucleotide adenylyltransferase